MRRFLAKCIKVFARKPAAAKAFTAHRSSGRAAQTSERACTYGQKTRRSKRLASIRPPQRLPLPPLPLARQARQFGLAASFRCRQTGKMMELCGRSMPPLRKIMLISSRASFAPTTPRRCNNSGPATRIRRGMAWVCMPNSIRRWLLMAKSMWPNFQ